MQKMTKWILQKEEKQRKKQQMEEIKEYNQEKQERLRQERLRQENAIISEVFKPIKNSGDLTMNAIQVWKETKAIKTKREEIVNIDVKSEKDIQKLMSLLEKLGLKLQKLNSRKSIEKWEHYHVSSLETMIASIGIEYENIKNSKLSEKVKRMAYERMISRAENIFLRLKTEYNIED